MPSFYFFHENLIDRLPNFFNTPGNRTIVSPLTVSSYLRKIDRHEIGIGCSNNIALVKQQLEEASFDASMLKEIRNERCRKEPSAVVFEI